MAEPKTQPESLTEITKTCIEEDHREQSNSPSKVMKTKKTLWRQMSWTGVIVILLASCIRILHAQTPTPPPSPTKDATRESIATVSRIDPQSKTIDLVTWQGQELHFGITNTTKVTKSDKEVSFEEILRGSTVGIRYVLNADGKNMLIALRTDGEIPPPDPIRWPGPKSSPVKS